MLPQLGVEAALAVFPTSVMVSPSAGRTGISPSNHKKSIRKRQTLDIMIFFCIFEIWY